MGNPAELEEFEIIENPKQQPDEIVIYRDKDDMAREFVDAESLKRFHLNQPAYAIHLDNGTDIYEITPAAAYYIIRHSNNQYAPYVVRYQTFDFKNELEDEKEKDVTDYPVMETIRIYRDIYSSERTFVTKDVLVRFHLEKKYQEKVLIDDLVIYEIDAVDAINIINHAINPFAPYSIEYVAIEFEEELPKRREIPIPYYEKIIPYEEKPQKNTKRNLRKPRPRMEGESDELYVAYLEGFYDSMFGLGELREVLEPSHRRK